MTKSSAEINELFCKDALRQSWLDVEAALAEVQGEMQIIPQEAAREISKKAHLKYLDCEELTRDIKRTKAPIVSLTKQLAAACEKDHGGYVHWGATTQNIIQTGRILQIRKAHLLMRREFGEVTEGMGKDVIGSSTMPQKVNSKVACNIITVAARIRSQMFLAFEGMHSSHEGDAATNKMMSEALDTVCTSVYEMTLNMKSLVGELQLNPEAMRQNLDKTKGLIVAENIMMTLAPVLGRQKAHDLLHHAAELAVAGDKNLSEILKNDSAVSASISQEKLDEALDPVNYLGDSVKITEDTIARVRKVLPKLARVSQ